MSKLRAIELSYSLNNLWRCKVELEQAKYPLFLEKLIIIIKKIDKLHNWVREKKGEGIIKRQFTVEPNFGNVATNLPDFDNINILLKDVLRRLASQRAGENFNKKIEEITKLVQNLYEDYENANSFKNHYGQSIRGLTNKEYQDLVDLIHPKYLPLLRGLRDWEVIKSPVLKDPTNKDLPSGKIAYPKIAVQKITTYETGSKAPLIEKGRGLAADLDKKYRKS